MKKMLPVFALASALLFVTPAHAAYDGVVAHILAKPGQRDALIEALRPLARMEGLIDIVVAKDTENPDAVWLTEIWESKELHDAATTGAVFKVALVRLHQVMLKIEQNYKTVPEFGNRLK